MTLQAETSTMAQGIFGAAARASQRLGFDTQVLGCGAARLQPLDEDSMFWRG